MGIANKIAALLDVLTRADVEALPPAQRHRFADQCRHWAELAEPPRTETPKAGVLLDLKRGPRDE